jgi:hypothetical protein
VIVVEDVLLVPGPDGGLLLPLQHLTVPAILYIIFCLREYQLPAYSEKNYTYALRERLPIPS